MARGCGLFRKAYVWSSPSGMTPHRTSQATLLCRSSPLSRALPTETTSLKLSLLRGTLHSNL